MIKLKDVKKFNDADFIEWAKCSTWTAKEAISALYGYKLRRNHAIDDLINLTCKREALQLQFSELILETRIPAQADNWETREGEISREEKLLIIRRETLISYCDYNSLPEKFRTPAKWVQRASYNGLTIAREWKAIFPYSVKLNAVLSPQQELDYREFVDWLTRELEAPPKDLVCFAFNIHSERFEQTPDCGDLLAHIYSDLWMEEVADIEELLNKKIMVSWFLERCQAYKLDRKFLDWVSWVTRHPELISYLSGNERSQSAKSRAPKYDPVIQAVVNTILPELPKPTMIEFSKYFNDHGANSSGSVFEGIQLDVEGCSEAYFDGETLVCVDHDNSDREVTIKRRSLERYIGRGNTEL